jgi:hypothetical protein
MKRAALPVVSILCLLQGPAAAQEAPPPTEGSPPPASPIPPPQPPPPPPPSAYPPPAYAVPVHPALVPGPCPGVAAGEAWRCDPPRHFGITLALLKEYGFGGGLRGRFGHVGFEGAMGYMPYLVLAEDFHYYTTWQATGAFLVFFNKPHRKTYHGLKAGYAYNSLTHHGFLLDYAMEFSLRKHFTLSLGMGFQLFPQAAELVEARIQQDEPGYIVVKVSSVAMFQPCIGLGLHFYLL